MPPKGKNKRGLVAQPTGSGGKDASSNGSSSKRSKVGSEVRSATSASGSASTTKNKKIATNRGTAGGSKNSALGSTESVVRRKTVEICTVETSARSAPRATTPPATSLYQQRRIPTSATSTSTISQGLSLSPLAIPANVIQSGGRQGVDESSLVTENNSVLYNQEQWDTKKENEYRMSQLKEYVRNDLFPAWKFFSSKKQMIFSSKPGGIVLKICNDLKVHKDHQMYWWDTHKKNILDSLNRKRNDVTSYLKKRFCGKSYLLSLTHVCAILLYTIALTHVIHVCWMKCKGKMATYNMQFCEWC